MENGQSNFLDKRTILSLVLVVSIYVGWSYYMNIKYPQVNQTKGAVAKNADGTGAVALADAQTNKELSASTPGAAIAPAAFKAVAFEDGNMAFEVVSRGMGVRKIKIKAYKSREGEPIYLSEDNEASSFASALVGDNSPLDFEISSKGDHTFVGVAKRGNLEITKTVVVDTAKYTLTTDIHIAGIDNSFKGLATELVDIVPPEKKGGFLGPPADKKQFYVVSEGSGNRTVAGDVKPVDSKKNATVASLDSHYFALAIADNSLILPEFSAQVVHGAGGNGLGVLRMSYPNPASASALDIKYVGFAGPKSYELLSAVDERLGGVVDYGTFAVIARPMLTIMKFFYSWVHNWGIAIILLTLLVRLIVMPFNLYSFRSMKVMQKLQPEIAKLKEKYKDDTATFNAKSMELYKENKANPVGGCLPMFLQFPIFIALFQTLGQSIELYREPFGLWITDLSYRDPYFVLPVLTAGVMFINQKMTPTTADPAQAKIMLAMPVIFSIFMITQPSGLTLYIFVSTLFAIIQQMLFLKGPSAQTAPVPA